MTTSEEADSEKEIRRRRGYLRRQNGAVKEVDEGVIVWYQRLYYYLEGERRKKKIFKYNEGTSNDYKRRSSEVESNGCGLLSTIRF